MTIVSEIAFILVRNATLTNAPNVLQATSSMNKICAFLMTLATLTVNSAPLAPTEMMEIKTAWSARRKTVPAAILQTVSPAWMATIWMAIMTARCAAKSAKLATMQTPAIYAQMDISNKLLRWVKGQFLVTNVNPVPKTVKHATSTMTAAQAAIVTLTSYRENASTRTA